MGPAPGPRCPAGNGKPPRGSVIYAGASASWRGQTRNENRLARDEAFTSDFPKKFSEDEQWVSSCTCCCRARKGFGLLLIRRSTDRSVELNNENNILIDNWQFCEWYYQRHEKFTRNCVIKFYLR